jgi:hypothetical protein
MLDARLARNENLLIAGGTAIVPNSWDDHGIHLREHNDYRKTQDYLTADQDIKQKFEFHCTQHEALLNQALAKQVAMQQAMQPQPPPKPGAAPAGPPQSATDQG